MSESHTPGWFLASAYANAEPEAAARALEELPSEGAALFLAALDADPAARLVEQMSPGPAARRLSAMEPEAAAAILMELDSRGCVEVLRICSGESRQALLARLPARRVQHFRRAIEYTLDTVGAWIDYDVAALPGTRSVGEALQLLRRRRREDDGLVFVLRGAALYAGVVTISTLLHTPADTPLSRVADRRVRALSDAADVDEIEALDDWDLCAMLPVTAPDGSLLGGLSRAGLRRALRSVFPQLPPSQPDSLLAHLFIAYLRTGTEMLRLLIGRGASTPTTRSGDEH